jgi:hypothetical protein
MKSRSFQFLTYLHLLLFVLASVSAAQQGPKPVVLRRVQSEKARDSKLDKAIMRILGEDGGGSDHPVNYYYNRVDLNGDGKPEVLVYVFGPSVCGTGGCTSFVFQSEGNGYKLISEISPARNPIIVSQSRTHGWNDLIMFVSGGGIQPGYYVLLAFNGRQYPQNPTVAPAKPLRFRAKGTAYVDGSGASGSGLILRPHNTHPRAVAPSR